MKKQHVQLPHNMTKTGKLTPNDLLVYVTIKKYMNNKTREAFPALTTLSKDCGFSINTIRKSIKILSVEGWILIIPKGRKNIYKFPKHKGYFEMFSFDFLENDVPPKEKAYIVTMQQFMIKEKGVGKTSYSNEELSTKINLSESKIKTYDKKLEDTGSLSIIKAEATNEYGLARNIKFFNLEELGQALLFMNQKVDKIAEKQESQDKTIQYLLDRIKKLEKEKQRENVEEAKIIL